MTDTASTPRQVGPYALHELLGRGGMGAVYHATTRAGAHVALKLIRPELMHDADVRRRFAREARAAARLEHPNITRLLDFGADGADTYMVMELVRGEVLTTWRRRPPDGETLRATFIEMLSALAHAHARGVVHRDLKPENVMISFGADARPVAKIMDFGVAHFRDERGDADGSNILIGTPAYMSPEQALRAGDVSPAADLYAMGVMLFEFVAGRLPFESRSSAGQLYAHLNTPVPPLVSRAGLQIDGPLEELVHALMAKKPHARPLFAVDALRCLEAVTISGSAARTDPETPETEPDQALRRTEIRTGRPLAQASLDAPSASAPFALFTLRDPPFCGREAELHELKALAQEAIDTGSARVAVVVGDPGSGRTRLTAVLQEQLEEHGVMQVWRGQSDAAGEGELALREALRRGLGVYGLPVPDTSLRLRELLERQLVADPWEHSALTEYLGVGEPGAASQRLRHENSRWALVERVLARAATARPVALILDDADATDGAPGRFVDWLLSSGGLRPPCLIVLCVQASATEADSPVGRALEVLRRRGDALVRWVVLSRLELREMQRLVRAAVPMDPSVATGVAMRSGGSPLLAVETIRHLVDTGRLEGWGRVPTAEEVLLDLPVGIGDIVRRRVEDAAASPGAEPQTLEVWMRLSVLGMSFDDGLAMALLNVRRDAFAPHVVTRAIATGVARGVLREDRPGEIRFESTVLRDALRTMARRADVAAPAHLDAAAVLAARADADAHAGEIAWHFTQAGTLAAALRWHRRDGDDAIRRKAYERALGAFDALLALGAATPDAPAPELQHARLRCAEALVELGRAAPALELLDAAEDAAQSALGTAMRLRAELAARHGDVRAARALYTEAVVRFGAEADPLGQAWAEVGLGALELRDGRIPQGEQALLRARETFSTHGDAAGEATVLLWMSRAALDTGLVGEAGALARRAERRHVAITDRHGAALCILLQGEVDLVEGRTSDAAEAFDRARGELIAAGDRRGAARATHLLGVVAEVSGREARARSLFRDALRTFDDLGDQQHATLSRLALARLDAQTGAWEAAVPAIDRVLARDAVERHDDTQFVRLLVETARVALVADRRALATRLLETASFKLARIAEHAAMEDLVDEVNGLLVDLRVESD